MQIKYLFPHRFKLIGWLISIPAFVLMLFVLHYDLTFNFLAWQQKGTKQILPDGDFLINLQTHNFTGEAVGITLILGLLLVAFSKEKLEDERITKIRLESILWAVYVNAAFLILSIVFFYGWMFLKIMVYNICTPVIIFIVRFNLLMYLEKRNLKKISYEKLRKDRTGRGRHHAG